jgi:hypothetical protein
MEEGARPVKDVEVGMGGPEVEGDAGALVVAGYEVDGGAAVSNAEQGLQRHLDKGRRDACAEKEVATVDDEVDLAAEGRLEGAVEVGEKVGTPAAALDAGAEGEIKAEMGIGEEQETDGV